MSASQLSPRPAFTTVFAIGPRLAVDHCFQLPFCDVSPFVEVGDAAYAPEVLLTWHDSSAVPLPAASPSPSMTR